MAKKKFARSKTFDSKFSSTLFSVFMGLLLLLGLWLLTRRLPAHLTELVYLGATLRVWVYLILGLIVLLWFAIPDMQKRADWIAVLLGLAFAGIVLLGLNNTSFALNGASGDAGLLIAQITKFAYLPGAVDFAYKDLPPFYPPAYLLLLGKIAGLAHIEPYRMLKYGLISVGFILPVLVRQFWFWLQPRWLAVAAALSLLLFQDWYKPYEWLALVLFVPWWLYFIDQAQAKEQTGVSKILLGSLIGGLLFSTYYYYFFIGALAFVLRLLFLRVRPKRNSIAVQYGSPALLTLAGSAFFSAPYWFPLVSSMWIHNSWTALQNRYFVPEFNNLIFPFLEPSLTGALLLGGLTYLLYSFRKNAISLSLLCLLAAAYVWQILGYFAFLANSPLLTFKARDFSTYILALAAVFAAAQLLSKPAVIRRWRDMLSAALVILLLYYGQVIAAKFAEDDLLEVALSTQYPQEITSQYRQIVSNQYREHVILADGTPAADLSIYLPVYQFLPWAAAYSHPAGDYNARLDFLQRLSKISDPAWFAAALMNNRYSHIDEIVMLPAEGGFLLGYRADEFPYPAKTDHIFFAGKLFDPRYFSASSLGAFALFEPIYGANSLQALPAFETYEPEDALGDFANGQEFYDFLSRFYADLEFERKQEYWAGLSELYSE